MNCKRCGSPLSEHSKFCESCGMPIVEDVVDVTVEEKVVDNSQKENFFAEGYRNVDSEQVGFMSKILLYLTNGLTKPVTSLDFVNKGDVAMPNLMYLLIKDIFYAIWITISAGNWVTSTIGLSGYQSMAYRSMYAGGDMRQGFGISMFVKVLIVIVFIDFAIMGVYFLAVKMMGRDADFKTWMGVYAVSSTAFIYAGLVSVILASLGIDWLGSFLFLIAGVIGYVVLLKGMEMKMGVEGNRLVWVNLIALAGIFILYFIVCLIVGTAVAMFFNNFNVGF